MKILKMKLINCELCVVFILLGFTAIDARSPDGLLRYVSRIPKQIIGMLTSSANLEELDYPFCKINNQTAACLEDVVCAGEKGTFMGYCGYADGVCCNVLKTCNGKSASHAVRFQNPKYPQNESESRLCPFTLHIGRGICAVRMIFDSMQLSNYANDHCPVESLTILGSNKKTAPLCGNMTGWQTTFEVTEFSTLTLAYTLQGNPNYKFSLQLLQIPCKTISRLRSPINAGIRNVDAVDYIPDPSLEANKTDTSKTTEQPTTTDPTTTDPTTDETTNTSDEDEVTTLPPVRSAQDPTTTAQTTLSTLPVGTIPTTATTRPLVIAKQQQESEIELETSYDPLPATSIFRRIFESKINDKCYVYEDQEFLEGIPTSSRFVEARREVESSDGKKCWHYDVESEVYKVSEDCEAEEEEKEEENYMQGGFRVVGGRLTKLNEYPWQVALLNKRRFFCGGALISDRHVVTASHCLYGSFATGIQHLKVSLGDHDLRTKNETNNTLLGVKRVIWHLNYDGDSTENDIGLLELSEPLEYSYSITPANLPTDLNHSYEGESATVTGWGRDNLRTKKTSPVLKEYTAVVDNIDTCVKRWKSYPKVSAIKDMHICLNVTHGTPCHGDSGGPLVACSGSRCTLIGVVSFGFPLCRNVGLPAVFTRITSYRRWIDINTTPIPTYDL